MVLSYMTYPSADRARYLQGMLYSEWKRKRKNGQSTLFQEIDNDPGQKQIPVASPPLPTQRYCFGELFAGIRYLDRGFRDVNRYYYYSITGYDSFEKAVKILGPETAKFVCQQFPQPPDLLVRDKKDRFFFVEVKLPTDRLNKNQIHFFRMIERYLNRNVSKNKKVPHLLPAGHWIEVLRLYPE